MQIVAGFRYMLSHTKLRWLFAFVSVGMFVAMSFELVIIHFLTETVRVGVENIAWVSVSNIIGITAGAWLAPN
ncbi:hypothetical protein [Geomicrobium sp. JCM 19037]|uniref:hypothetical protein n=1 Tax=Geomicrobium sp. JCM 19037 TaxID=1460634 RepID=UPI0005A96252|nr:hypothetical protein [Geomicrobium sp. JCM 19037]